ncbi:hypothetical protein TESG_00771 [Trichophyton tonsurans CBS 112818]|uniref:Uncharacterized protein n=2 Tax=Trichophyton TaxID=5550 RepID=F2PN25_TRIEC|nr:hypothetical protein TESG_00771 [Trichophyton tonsurans CBS 112818]EGE03293.1 hypothetical protein TEQG_02327 [Trichophyton equinum CBS 127.97]
MTVAFFQAPAPTLEVSTSRINKQTKIHFPHLPAQVISGVYLKNTTVYMTTFGPEGQGQAKDSIC